MRVLIAPDCFTGTLSAVEAAAAIASGWRRRCPGDELDLAPLSDGGTGFASVVAAATGGSVRDVTVTGPLRTPVTAQVVVVGADRPAGGPTAYIEAAQANGLHLVPVAHRDPRITTTWGVGQLVRAAIDAGATRIVIGLGGSATNDGGVGLLAALGAVLRDSEGADISERAIQGAIALDDVASVDLSHVRALLSGIDLWIATDVDNPLLGARGASHGYARQKHAAPDRVLDVELDDLESRLARFSTLVGRGPDGRDPAVALGAGAAGGLGYALLAVGGHRVAGIETVLAVVGLGERIARADLVVTGEGAFDWQSLRGKVVSGVAAAALSQGRPVVVLAGRVDVGRREYTGVGVSAAFAVVDEAGSIEAALAEPHARLADLAARVAGTWGGADL